MLRSVALVALITGCVAYDETVHVHVRDPRQVTVVTTGEGERPDPGAQLEYTPLGGVIAHCAWCEYDSERRVVSTAGAIDLVGDPGVLARVGDHLEMRFDYVAPLPCTRHHGLCERPAFALALDTPEANVTGVDFERKVSISHGEMIGAKLGVAAGVVSTALGLVLGGYVLASSSSTSAREMGLGVASGFVVVGGTFLVAGLSTLTASDSDRPIQPP